MKKLLTISIALVIAISIYACEKDDICAETTPTTPRLIVDFYDFANQSAVKNVANLTAVAEGATDSIVFNEALAATDSTRYYFNGNSLALPLNVADSITTYRLKINSQSTNPLVFNEDIVKINYATQQVYVSRACGYKTSFNLTSITEEGVVEEQWIRNLMIENANVENENDVHVKIYF